MLSERRRHALALFAPLGPTYDRVGSALSFGQDPRWRRFLVSRLPPDGGHVLDVATGTGLVAEALLEQGFRVTGLDQSTAMLAVARERFGDRVTLVEGRRNGCRSGPAFDHLTFTYLLRYVDDPGATLAELARVVRPGGTIAMLEFGLPRGPWRPLWDLWVGVGLPVAPRALARLAVGRAVPRPVDPRLPRALPGAGAARPVARRRDRRAACPAAEPRRRPGRLGASWNHLATPCHEVRLAPLSTPSSRAAGATT